MHKNNRIQTSDFGIYCFMAILAIPLLQAQPVFTRQPEDSSKSLGDSATFRIQVQGNASYQWTRDGREIAGATNSFLTLSNLARGDAGRYQVQAANASGTATSRAALLDVDPTFTVMAASPIARESGQGVSWVDFNGDGWVDLYCAGEGRHLLFQNNRDSSFTRVDGGALASDQRLPQVLMGGFWGDYDNDGLPDLYAVYGGTLTDQLNALYHNDGGGRFSQVRNTATTRRSTKSVQAIWGDFDNSGSLDLFVVNSAANNAEAIPNSLFLGDGKGGWTTWTNGAAFSQRRAFNGGAASDYDLDGDIDLVVTAWQAGGNVFTVENLPGVEMEHFGIGSFGPFVKSVSWGDYDNDGDQDLFVGYEFRPALILRNDGDGNFTEQFDIGLAETATQAFSGAWGDYDNDGWLDLLVTCYRQNQESSAGAAANNNPDDYLYHNNGDGTFTRILSGSVANDGRDSVTAAWGDYDNDGFLDLVVGRSSWWPFGSTVGEKNTLFHNNGNGNSWLTVKLVGTVSNRGAVGAKVFLKSSIGGKMVRQFREILPGHGWASQNDIRAHFGLGDATEAAEIRVEWPGGKVTELKNVAARRVLEIVEPDGRPKIQITRHSDGIELKVESEPGTAVSIEQSGDLSRWDPLPGFAVETGSGIGTLKVRTDAGALYYRARKR